MTDVLRSAGDNPQRRADTIEIGERQADEGILHLNPFHLGVRLQGLVGDKSALVRESPNAAVVILRRWAKRER